MDLTGKRVTLHDMSLRDGMHAKAHQISPEQMVAVATALDAAGVPLIEVTHGDGLGGASVNYGFPAASDEEYLRAVVPEMKQAKISALLIPGIGTVDLALPFFPLWNATTDASGAASFRIPIPSNALLKGLKVHTQSLVAGKAYIFSNVWTIEIQ